MNNYNYAPLPIGEYRIRPLSECETSTIAKLGDPEYISVWNLFWLSVPALDVLPVFGKREDWSKHYKPVEGALKAITADALADEVLKRKLLMHPFRFIQWFTREDHSIYDCYYALGGQQWVDTVLIRANLALMRIETEEVSCVRDNVHIFRRRVA